MVESLIFTPFDRVLWIICFCIVIFGGIKFLSRGRHHDNPNEKLILYAFGIFFICFSLNLIFLYLCDFSIQGQYRGHNYFGEMNNELVYGGLYNTNRLFAIFYSLALYSWFIGVLSFIILFEKIHQRFFNREELKKPKYFLSILNIVLMVIAGFSFDFMHLLFMLNIWLLTGILFWLSIQASKELQAVLILIIIGFNINLFAAQLRAIKHIIGLSPIIPPILMIIGSLVMISPFFIDIDAILKKKPMFHWKLLITTHAIMLIAVGSFMIYSTLPVFLMIFNLLQNVPIYITLIIFGIIQKHHKEKLETHKVNFLKHEEKKDLENLFRGFIKPKLLTEEEVSVSKENKICLVCKGQLKRNIYICPECNTFYCTKCSLTLSQMENACWVCETPFDETKPIKKLEQIEDEVMESEDSTMTGFKKINEENK